MLKDIMNTVVYIHIERERDIMGRKWNNIKEKRHPRMLIRVVYMLNLA